MAAVTCDSRTGDPSPGAFSDAEIIDTFSTVRDADTLPAAA
ncbi:hypothetical protein [Beijerinckia sp. L45]|nr:hypothetical protein [Beijerinckia sp. L45]